MNLFYDEGRLLWPLSTHLEKKTCETIDLFKIGISDSETTGAAHFKTLADVLSIPEALQKDKELSNL